MVEQEKVQGPIKVPPLINLYHSHFSFDFHSHPLPHYPSFEIFFLIFHALKGTNSISPMGKKTSSHFWIIPSSKKENNIFLGQKHQPDSFGNYYVFLGKFTPI